MSYISAQNKAQLYPDKQIQDHLINLYSENNYFVCKYRILHAYVKRPDSGLKLNKTPAI